MGLPRTTTAPSRRRRLTFIAAPLLLLLVTLDALGGCASLDACFATIFICLNHSGVQE